MCTIMLNRLGAGDKDECGNHGLTKAVTITVNVSAAINGVAKRKKRLLNNPDIEKDKGKC
jgi:hypothetical protein